MEATTNSGEFWTTLSRTSVPVRCSVRSHSRVPRSRRMQSWSMKPAMMQWSRAESSAFFIRLQQSLLFGDLDDLLVSLFDLPRGLRVDAIAAAGFNAEIIFLRELVGAHEREEIRVLAGLE